MRNDHPRKLQTDAIAPLQSTMVGHNGALARHKRVFLIGTKSLH